MVRNLSTKTSTMKGAFFALAFVTGLMITGSASAQSDEYQRGYDAGYRHGAQAQAQADQDERGDASAGILVIEEANYATRERLCDATDAVRAALGRPPPVTLVADNRLCGDPAENQVRRLVVRYHCGNEASQRLHAIKEETVSLSCR